MCLVDWDAWRGESTIVLNLLCPLFQGLANAVHFREPDKTIEVWRISTKPEASYRAEAFCDKCWALTCKVYKLLIFFSAEPKEKIFVTMTDLMDNLLLIN